MNRVGDDELQLIDFSEEDDYLIAFPFRDSLEDLRLSGANYVLFDHHPLVCVRSLIFTHFVSFLLRQFPFFLMKFNSISILSHVIELNNNKKKKKRRFIDSLTLSKKSWFTFLNDRVYFLVICLKFYEQTCFAVTYDNLNECDRIKLFESINSQVVERIDQAQFESMEPRRPSFLRKSLAWDNAFFTSAGNSWCLFESFSNRDFCFHICSPRNGENVITFNYCLH